MTTSPRLLTKFTNIFGRKDESSPSSSSEDDDEEMRDSVFSEISSVRANPNTPPPLRTVQIDQTFGEKDKQAVDEAFDQLMKEYALSSTIRPSLTQLTTQQKSIMLMQSSKKPNSKKHSIGSSGSNGSSSILGGGGGSSSGSSGGGNGTFGTTSKSSNLLSFKPSTYSRRKSVRDVFADNPEYFCRALRSTPTEDDLVHLRIHLRSSVVSWTDAFLALDGYEALTHALGESKKNIKKQSDKKIELLCRCFKTIMIHENTGIEKVLTQPEALGHVRDILFGPSDVKVKALYLLDVQTRQQLLGVLCTLPSIQVTTQEGQYIHGYDVLRQLLRDKPEDFVEEPKRHSLFPMSLKADTETMMQKISNGETGRPRYTAWMRELQLTVDRHIEPMTYLSQVLDYNFESAYRQLRANQHIQQQQQDGTPSQSPLRQTTQEVVMVDEGVVDYLITNLRLICTLVTTPATTFSGTYDKYEQEKMRMEIMLSGFKKITHALSVCPHPTLHASYIRYLQPLLQPWADLFEMELMDDHSDDMWEDVI
ncbi:armadillo-type protein [Zychaea mexicana]|uniref:armadillo-type protein n=1 Tax=Zychaea mexicana TaxID=64656 RepID=UPI0022FF0754|nr:armadillo-type protein [Zychaea mexicana]KAI9493773.1 armadillo-type protein [Zychaea mexicana]